MRTVWLEVLRSPCTSDGRHNARTSRDLSTAAKWRPPFIYIEKRLCGDPRAPKSRNPECGFEHRFATKGAHRQHKVAPVERTTRERVVRCYLGVQRVLIIKNSGSGKTTLAGSLAGRLGDPHIELDGIFRQAGWTPLDPVEFRRGSSSLLNASTSCLPQQS